MLVNDTSLKEQEEILGEDDIEGFESDDEWNYD
jgi:hypothetical protein